MKKQILFFDQARFDERLQTLNEAREKFESLLQEFNSLNLFKLKSVDELASLAREREIFIKSRIAEELPAQSFGVFKLKRESAVELLELPDFSSLNQMAFACLPLVGELRYMSIEGQHITLKVSEIQLIRDAYSITAKDENQIRLGETLSKAANAMDELNKVLQDTIRYEMSWDTQMGKFFDISTNAVKVSETFFHQNWTRF